jgi:protoporphyrinogen oxidase
MKPGVLALAGPRAPATWDRVPALAWLGRTFGRASGDLLEPLLRKKFGAWAPEFSLLAFYGRLARERSGLSLGGGTQRLAAFPGGSGDLIRALEAACRSAGAEILLDAPASALEPRSGLWRIRTGPADAEPSRVIEAKRVLSTLPLPLTLDLLPPALATQAPQRAVRHLDAAVVRILCGRSVSPFYFCALPDASTPFVSLVEATRLRPHPAGLAVLYLACYGPPGTLEAAESLKDRALDLLVSLPHPPPAPEILSFETWSVPHVQPFFDLGYLGRLPRHRAPWPGLYFCDASQIFPGDRGVSATAAQAERVAALILADAGGS